MALLSEKTEQILRVNFNSINLAKNKTKVFLMPNYTHILFDLDGTLTDSRPGISNSLQYALRQMKIDGYSEEIMDRFIGPPLQDGFKNLFGLDELNANLAT